MSDAANVYKDPATLAKEKKSTEIGSVFVSNYPAYSFWNDEDIAKAESVLDNAPAPGTPMGLYMHIPFCRKRCKFCYFKVYTGKNASEIQNYLDALASEIDLYAEKPIVKDRNLDYVYFGGGTPSFISVKHLKWLVERAKAAIPWDSAREVAFECEPGTLTESKLDAIKEIGVTRLSLGIEHFDDDILQENGRAHLSKEIYRVQPWVKALGFNQVNIDLIAGMVGETWDGWKDTVEKAVDYDADSITIYQLELPFNAVYSQHLRQGEKIAVADWETKRDWHQYAIEKLEAAGYEISSAYTMIKKDSKYKDFVYRDALWQGADMIATGVASFSHVGGVHFQNAGRWEQYLSSLETGKLPISRAFATSSRDQLIREMILQLKIGHIEAAYFQQKFGVDIISEFNQPFTLHQENGMLNIEDGRVTLTVKGLLRVDQLLPEFYDPQYQNARYT